MTPIRAVVFAYGEIGWTALRTLLEVGVDVPLVVTHEDAPDERCWFHSVGDLARGADIPVIAPADVNASGPGSCVAAAEADFLFSFYYRQILTERLLAHAKRGALNLHGSLLPRFRGRAPVNWVLIEGEKETGVTLHYMDAKADHGDIVARRAVAIERDDSALTLTHKLASAAAELLREEIPRLAADRADRIPQDHGLATTYGRRRPADGEIDWSLPAERVRNLVRAVTEPWPGAFTWLRGRKLMVWWGELRPLERAALPGEVGLDAGGAPWVATGDQALALTRVGWEGEAPTEAARWARREALRSGERCESPGGHP